MLRVTTNFLVILLTFATGCAVVNDDHLDEVLARRDMGVPDRSDDVIVEDTTPDTSNLPPALGSDACGLGAEGMVTLTGDDNLEFSMLGRTSKVSGACSLSGIRGADTFFHIKAETAGDQWHFHLTSLTGSNPVLYLLSAEGDGCNVRSACIGDGDGNQCDGDGEEHFAVTLPAAGDYFLGVDDANPIGDQIGAYTLFATNLTKQCNGMSSSHGEGCDVPRMDMPATALLPIGETGNLCDGDCRIHLRADEGATLTTTGQNSTLPEANVLDLSDDTDQKVTVSGVVGGGGCSRRPALYRVSVPDGKSLRVTPFVGDALCTGDEPSFLRTSLLLSGGTPAGFSGTGACKEIIAPVTQGTYVIQILPPPSGDRTLFQFEAALE